MKDWRSKMPDKSKTGVIALMPYVSTGLGVASVIQQLITPGLSLLLPVGAMLTGGISIYTRKTLVLPLAGAVAGAAGIIGGLMVEGLRGVEAMINSPFVTSADILNFNRVVGFLPAGILAAIGVAVNRNARLPVLKSIKRNAPENPFGVEIAPRVTLKSEDRFLHTMIVGTTGTGKSSRVLKPMIWQDLQAIKQGKKMGLTVIEPKGDFSADVAEMAKSLDIPVTFLNPEDPKSPKFNPLEGDAMTAAEIMRTVLQSLFGKQEAFFRQAQEVAARNTVLLLKAAYGDRVDIKTMTEALRDEEILKACLKEVEKRQGGPSSLTQYFRQEVLGKDKDKMMAHTLGLRLQLEDITGNEMLNKVLVGKSDINLDKHLEGGGVLVVNTAMGKLGKLGDVFGQFIMMHLQSAVFRRPGNEKTRPYHVLYVDEFPRYVNPEFERLLAIGRSFRCAAVLALQTTSQLLLESKPAFRDIVLENCRNKIILNLGSAEDAKRFAAEFGEKKEVKKSRTYHRDSLIFIPLHEDSIREDEKYEQRFNYTDLMEMPAYHSVVRIVVDGKPQPPQLVKLELSEWDKKKHMPKKDAISTNSPGSSKDTDNGQEAPLVEDQPLEMQETQEIVKAPELDKPEEKDNLPVIETEKQITGETKTIKKKRHQPEEKISQLSMLDKGNTDDGFFV